MPTSRSLFNMAAFRLGGLTKVELYFFAYGVQLDICFFCMCA